MSQGSVLRALSPVERAGSGLGVEYVSQCFHWAVLDIDDWATCDLVDWPGCHVIESDNGNEWGVAMESARKCIADAKDIIRKAPVVAKAEERGEEEPKAEIYGSGRATEQGVTATGAAKRSCGNSRRRRMKETILPVQGVWRTDRSIVLVQTAGLGRGGI